MELNDSLDLLFEIRECFEDNEPINPLLLARIINHTNDALRGRSKLRPTGDAHRDRLVAARLNLRESSQ